MFLNKLEEKEKLAFLELAHYTAGKDNNFSLSEKDIINNYCLEMQIDNIGFDIEKFDLYRTLNEIKKPKSQKIVLLEIMILIYSDSFLHEEERKILEKILEEFNLSYHLATVYEEWAKAILSLYNQASALIEM